MTSLTSSSKLPVFRTAWRALRSPFEQTGDFLKLAWFPALLMLLTQFGTGMLAGLLGKPLLALIWLLAYPVIVTPLSVAWTRLLLIGREPAQDWPPFPFGSRELAYLGTSFALTLSVVCLPATAGAIAYLFRDRAWSLYVLVIAVVLLAICLGLGLRLSFLLPAIAVDSFEGIGVAWKQTQRCVWRIVGIGFLAGLPIGLLQSIIQNIGRHAENPTVMQSLILGLVGTIVGLLMTAVTAAAIALAYKQRTNWSPNHVAQETVIS